MKRLQGHQIENLTVEHVTVPAEVPNGSAPVVQDGQLVYVELGNAATTLVPLTTVVNGAPAFVFDSNHQLVMTEVPR